MVTSSLAKATRFRPSDRKDKLQKSKGLLVALRTIMPIVTKEGVSAVLAAKTVPEIRIMREEDFARITEIDYQVLGESRPDYWEGKVEMTGKRSPLPSLVAEIEGKVVGFILADASG